MGSTEATAASQEELTMLITGFGPFNINFPQNPSWEIARLLPAYLPPIRAKTKAATDLSTGSVSLPPVRLVVRPGPIRVNYQVVRSLVPKLWDPPSSSSSLPSPPSPSSPENDNLTETETETEAATHTDTHTPSSRPVLPTTNSKKIDMAIHIGMASPRPSYAIERRGHRDGYAMKDVDGEFLKDQERRVREGEKWIWHGEPQELETDFDLDDVLARWRQYSPDGLDLKISEDAGHYLCDFLYFTSLAHLHKTGRERKVVFLHVPADLSDGAIQTGRELVLQLVRSIAESEVARAKM